jgi:ABC-2 type transport system permease protein
MWQLIRMRVRRDRITLPIWIASTALLAFAGAAGVQAEFGTDDLRGNILKLALATPSLLALRGVPDGPSLGSYVYFQVFVYIAIMAALMNTFFVTRHTRADEERGRVELVAATPVRRIEPLVATLLVGVVANALLGTLVAVGFIGGGLPAGGSLLSGLVAGTTGLAFMGAAALVAQLAPTSRSANGLSAAVIGIAFLLRAIGDAAGVPDFTALTLASTWPSWLSPIGWAQQVFPFTRQSMLPLLLSLAFVVATASVALVVQSRRDLGASSLRERDGRATASFALRSSLGLAWRQQWPSIIGWAIGGAVLGLLAGGLSGTLVASNLSAQLRQVLDKFVPGGSGELTDTLVVAIVSIGGILAAAAGAQSIMHARGDESDGRTELVLASPVTRTAWLGGYLVVAVASAAAVAMATGLAAGLSFVAAGAAGDRFVSSLGAGVAQLPAALAFVAITALIFAVLPRLTIPLGWFLVGLGALVGLFGGLLNLPDAVRAASPFAHTPSIPSADPNWGPALVVLAVSVVIAVASLVLVRTRELAQ